MLPQLILVLSPALLVVILVILFIRLLTPPQQNIGRQIAKKFFRKDASYALSTTRITSPCVLPSKIPIIGHVLGFMRESHAYFARLSLSTALPIFTLRMPGSNLTFIKPSLAHHVPRTPHLLFTPVTTTIFRRALKFSDRSCAMLDDKTPEHRAFSQSITQLFHKELLQPERLRQHFITVDTFLRDEIAALGVSDDGSILQIRGWVLRSVVISVGRTLWGDLNGISPFSGTKFVDDLILIMEHMKQLTGPRFLIPQTLISARDRVLRRFDESTKRREFADGSFVHQLFNLCQAYGASEENFTDFQFLLLAGAGPNPAISAIWTVMHLFLGDYEWLELVRAEILEWISNESGDLDLNDVRERCPKLTAVWLEVLRHHSGFSIGRYVQEDTVFAEQWLLKKESFLMVSIKPCHVDCETWGIDASIFKPERFLMSDGKIDIHMEKKVRTFGVLGTVCPGRFLARHLTIGLVIRLLTSFDIEVPRQERPAVPAESKNGLLGMPMPASDVKINVRSQQRMDRALRFCLGNSKPT